MALRVFVRCGAAAATILGSGICSAQMPQMMLPQAANAPPGAPIVAAAPEADAPAKPKPKPVPFVVLTNASASTATAVVVQAGEMSVKLDKPLPAKAKISLKLPKLKGCTVQVAAVFESGGEVETGDINICKDKSIRFTD